MDILVSWTSAEGGEHEESWPSLERFRVWAQAQRLRCVYRAYAQDEDGEWVPTEDGRIGF